MQEAKLPDGSKRYVLTCYLPSSKVGAFSSYTRPWQYTERDDSRTKTFVTTGISRQYPTACVGGKTIWPLWSATVMAIKRLLGYRARKYSSGQGQFTPEVLDEGCWVPLLNVIVEYLLEPSTFAKAGDKLFVAKFMPQHLFELFCLSYERLRTLLKEISITPSYSGFPADSSVMAERRFFMASGRKSHQSCIHFFMMRMCTLVQTYLCLMEMAV